VISSTRGRRRVTLPRASSSGCVGSSDINIEPGVALEDCAEARGGIGVVGFGCLRAGGNSRAFLYRVS